MSLKLFSILSNEIETIVDVDGNISFKQAHVGKYLGIRNIRDNYSNFPSHNSRPRSSIHVLNEREISTTNSINPESKD